MARFYKIKIGSIWLTDTGAEGGRPCKVDVDGAAALLAPDQGNVSTGNDGTPFREKPLTPTGGGRPFVITAAFMTKTVYDNLKSALDTAAGDNSEFNVTGDGVPGNWDVDAIVNDDPQYLGFEGFTGADVLKGVRISLITTAIN
jgi:hypothetical protein